VQLTAYVRASNLAFMIVVTPAMASCAPGERLAMVLPSLALEPLLGELEKRIWHYALQRGVFLAIFYGCECRNVANLTLESAI
jgi:hypothetical protein